MGEQTGVGSIDTEQDEHHPCASCSKTGTVAHDVNNALTGVLGHIVALSNATQDVQTKDKLDKVINGIVHISSLIEELQTPEGKGRANFIDLNLSHILIKTCDLFEGDLHPDIKFVKEIEENIFSFGDPNQIQRAILNILINARRAVTQDGEIKLTLSKNQETHTAEIVIEDNGRGIAKEHLDKIFQPKFTTKNSNQGKGLGLASVQDIILEHKGSIAVTSEVDQGATFSLQLPIIKPTAEGAIESGIIRTPIGRGKTLVIVDDSSIALEAITFFMSEAGFTVYPFDNAQRSLEWFRENKEEVDLVFLDLHIGQDSATEIFPQLHDLSPKVPVIISSGENNSEVDTILSQGARNFYQKPFDYNKVLKDIHEIVTEEDS